MATYALGDIHGAAKALDQVLDRAPYEPGEDTLVFLGDVADGWPETRRAVQTLVDLPPPKVHIMGNHDEWTRQWMEKGIRKQIWLRQGGRATIDSYERAAGTFGSGIPESHRKYFGLATRYWKNEGRFFTHAGFSLRMQDPTKETAHNLMWDRDLFKWLWTHCNAGRDWDPPGDIDEVYIGHTHVDIYTDEFEPVHLCDALWNLDTGAGYKGRLTMMRVEDHEYWQSDPVPELYPDVKRAR